MEIDEKNKYVTLIMDETKYVLIMQECYCHGQHFCFAHEFKCLYYKLKGIELPFATSKDYDAEIMCIILKYIADNCDTVRIEIVLVPEYMINYVYMSQPLHWHCNSMTFDVKQYKLDRIKELINCNLSLETCKIEINKILNLEPKLKFFDYEKNLQLIKEFITI